MLIVLSPAKTIDFSKNTDKLKYSLPVFSKEAESLIKILKSYTPLELSSLMGISAKLADLNFERFLKWKKNHPISNSKQAVFAFNGDVYDGLDIIQFNNSQLEFLNAHTRILSGLYGVLKPMDLIMPYRLEMGIRMENTRGKDLYYFWGDKITKNINDTISKLDGDKVLINLASNEYFKSINTKKLDFRIITPVFKEFKDNTTQIISFFAKKARGMMTRFITFENITNPEDIKLFNMDRYSYSEELSEKNQWVFVR